MTSQLEVAGVELFFHLFPENVVAFDKASWDFLHSMIYFQKVKNEHFEKRIFTLPPGTREKNVLRLS